MASKGGPAKTPEGRDSQMQTLAYELAEKRLREGTASAQEIVHLLKQGSAREVLEREKMQAENELLLARVEDLQSRVRREDLFEEAIRAMSRYRGEEDVVDEYDD